jgi:hypothetical protein
MVQIGFGVTVTVRVQVLTQPFFVTVTVTVKLDGGHVGHKSANMRAAFNCGITASTETQLPVEEPTMTP